MLESSRIAQEFSKKVVSSAIDSALTSIFSINSLSVDKLSLENSTEKKNS